MANTFKRLMVKNLSSVTYLTFSLANAPNKGLTATLRSSANMLASFFGAYLAQKFGPSTLYIFITFFLIIALHLNLNVINKIALVNSSV